MRLTREQAEAVRVVVLAPRAAEPAGRSEAARLHLPGWRAVPREFLIMLAGVLVYFGVRGRTEGNIDPATGNAHLIVDLERSLRIDIEAQVQDLLHGSDALTAVVNWVYIWGHWPVIAATLLWLVLKHRPMYVVTRNAMLLSGALGMVVFALFPVSPPRLLDLGLVDTVSKYSTSYRVLQPPGFVNQYAAMPSLHVGWDLLIGIAIAGSATHLWLRIVGWLLPALMAGAVVATANHYVLDALAGVVLVLVCRFVVIRVARWRGGSRASTHGTTRTGTSENSRIVATTPST